MKNLITIMTLVFSFQAFSQDRNAGLMPKGCDYQKEFKVYGTRLNTALNRYSTGKLDEGIKKKLPTESAISERDLKQEIFYFDPVKESCSFVKVSETPFGRWVAEQLKWKKLQDSEAKDVSFAPPEINHAYDISYWRSLPLGNKAELFNRRAMEGYSHLKSEIEKCKTSDPSITKLEELSKSLEKFYGIKP